MAEESERASLIWFMEQRFGIPAGDFSDCLLFKHRQSWWLLKKKASVPIPCSLKVGMVGLKAFQKVGAYTKPTTRLIQCLGRRATRSVRNLTEEELRILMNKGSIDEPNWEIEDGYVILQFGAYVLGLGLLVRGKILSQIPRKDLPFYK